MAVESREMLNTIERYLGGRLPDGEAEEFEARLLWDESLQDQFELTRRLREGVKDVYPVAPEVPAQKPLTSFARAASLAMAIGLGVVVGQVALRGDTAPDGVTSGQVYSIEVMRGEPDIESLPQVRAAAPDSWLTLLAYPPADIGGSALAELARRDDAGSWQTVWTGEAAAGGASDAVAITLRGRRLEPGVYRLSLRGSTGAGPETRSTEAYFRFVSD